MPRGYELTSYQDAQRALFRKIYSKEIVRLSGIINRLGYSNNNVYGLIISQINNGLDNSFGHLRQQMHHISKSDIGVNKSSRLQDFMSALELRANTLAIRKTANKLENTKNYLSVNQIMQMAYDAGSTVGLDFQDLKIQESGEFSMRIDSPVLSTTPIIKKLDQKLIMGKIPESKTLSYDTVRNGEREKLILANKQAFLNVKNELIRLGLLDAGQRQSAFKMLNLGYYFVENPKVGHLELSAVLFKKDFNVQTLRITELAMNLEKLTMAKKELEKFNKLSINDVYEKLFKVGDRARQLVISQYRMLPEIFSGFYNTYASLEAEIVKKKDDISKASKGVSKDK